MAKFVCRICGYVHEEIRHQRSVLYAGSTAEIQAGGEMSWAARHVVGGASEDHGDLRANFEESAAR